MMAITSLSLTGALRATDHVVCVSNEVPKEVQLKKTKRLKSETDWPIANQKRGQQSQNRQNRREYVFVGGIQQGG